MHLRKRFNTVQPHLQKEAILSFSLTLFNMYIKPKELTAKKNEIRKHLHVPFIGNFLQKSSKEVNKSKLGKLKKVILKEKGIKVWETQQGLRKLRKNDTGKEVG